MRRRVIAIGLDSFDPDLLARFMDAGELPNLRRLRDAGVYCRLENSVRYAGGEAPLSNTESCWVAFQTGVSPRSTGCWSSVRYDPVRYMATSDAKASGYDYKEFPPFFALGDDYRVAAFDLPSSAVCAGVNGIQIVGWGGHFPFVERGSQPAGLLDEITARYGKNGILYKDYGVFWNPRYARWLERELVESIRTRTQICEDLLAREPWDLFIAGFGEPHSAGHDLLFASDRSNPVHSAWKGDHDPLLRVYTEIDSAIGRIAEKAPEDACLMCFSVHGMEGNYTDLNNYFQLPELLYRFNFPGRIGFADGDPKQPLGPPFLTGRHWYWFGEVWRRRYVRSAWLRRIQSLLPGWLVWPASQDFLFPYTRDWFGPEVGWIPAVWYSKAWPRMRSFALLAFAEGQIRINLKGREANGLVAPEDYGAECDRISDFLRRVVNPRTGRPWVRDVVRTRTGSPLNDDPRLPHADLIVVYDSVPADVIDSPDVGRIGPVPYYRTGGHRASGFMLARGPGIESGITLPQADVFDLAPTILHLLGAPVPSAMEGSSLF